jgi:hypothetical protein
LRLRRASFPSARGRDGRRGEATASGPSGSRLPIAFMRSSRPRNGTTRESVFIVQLSRPWENLPVVPRAPKMRSARAAMKFGRGCGAYSSGESRAIAALAGPNACTVLGPAGKAYQSIRRVEQQGLGLQVILVEDEAVIHERFLRRNRCLIRQFVRKLFQPLVQCGACGITTPREESAVAIVDFCEHSVRVDRGFRRPRFQTERSPRLRVWDHWVIDEGVPRKKSCWPHSQKQSAPRLR